MLSASSFLQVLFFGFGWLFFMRKLFKDYEVRRDFSLQVYILKITPNYRNIFKTAFGFFLLFKPSYLVFNCLYSYFLISSCASTWKTPRWLRKWVLWGQWKFPYWLRLNKKKNQRGGGAGVIGNCFAFCLSKPALCNCKIFEAKSNSVVNFKLSEVCSLWLNCLWGLDGIKLLHSLIPRDMREYSLGHRWLKCEPNSDPRSFSGVDFTFKSKVKIKELC